MLTARADQLSFRLVMTERSERLATPATATPAERRWVEEFGLLGESMGGPRMMMRLWAWLLICDPPQQSSAGIARALGVSRASVSMATRLLMAGGMIRRSVVPGQRGHFFEADPDAFRRLPLEERFSALRRQYDRGLDALENPDGPRGSRLRAARDFYAFMEREVPRVMAAYRADRADAEETNE
jgi:hypothetical protein